MTFRLCDAAVGGTCSWTETKVVSEIHNGIFSTELGDTAPLSVSDFEPLEVFLELEIGAAPDNEILTPRQRLVSVPYALQCTNAELLEGVDLAGLASVVESQVLIDNVLSFPAGPTFSYDNQLGQQRFEFSAGLATTGALAVGSNAGSGAAWSRFGGDPAAQPQSGSMNSVGDLFVEDELEVGGALLLSKSLYLEGSAAAGAGGNQSLLFYDGNNRANEFIRFEPAASGGSVGRFVISEPILAGNNAVPAGILYHRFSNDSSSIAASNQIANSGDVFVEDDLEVGSDLLLSGNLYLEGNSATGAAADQTLYFYDNDNPANEFIRFEPDATGVGVGRFVISEPVLVGNNGVPDGVLYNRFANDSTSLATSSEIGNAGDVFVEDDLEVGDRIIASVVEIVAGSDISEQFRVAAPPSSDAGAVAPEPGTVLCIHPTRAGELQVCENAYDRTVAGIVSGAGSLAPGVLMGQTGSIASGDVSVALSGRVYVRADLTGGPIRPGDLLTTSVNSGRAASARDIDRVHGAVIGKAMTRLEDGPGLVLVLVSLQ